MNDHLVCARDVPGALAVKGGTTGRCVDCRHAVLISPSGMARLRRHPATKVLCTTCLAGRKARGDTEEVRPNPDWTSDLKLGVERR